MHWSYVAAPGAERYQLRRTSSSGLASSGPSDQNCAGGGGRLSSVSVDRAGSADYIERITVMINDLRRPAHLVRSVPVSCAGHRLSSLLCVIVGALIDWHSAQHIIAGAVVNSFAYRSARFPFILSEFRADVNTILEALCYRRTPYWYVQ